MNMMHRTEADLRVIANSFHQATVVLQDFIDEKPIPVLASQVNISQQEDVIIKIYFRMQLWLRSLAQLKDPMHFQAVCSGARSIFELNLDIRTLHRDPSLADQMLAFTKVSRYQNAQKTVNLLDKHPEIDRKRFSHQLTLLANEERRKEYESLLSKFWPTKPGKKGLQQPSHWYKSSVYEQGAELGIEYECVYRTEYAHHCWFVHAALVGIDGIPTEGLIVTFVRAQFIVQRSVIDATEIVAQLFHLFDARQELKSELDVLRVLAAKFVYEDLGLDGGDG